MCSFSASSPFVILFVLHVNQLIFMIRGVPLTTSNLFHKKSARYTQYSLYPNFLNIDVNAKCSF